jgi:hypothetical protein
MNVNRVSGQFKRDCTPTSSLFITAGHAWQEHQPARNVPLLFVRCKRELLAECAGSPFGHSQSPRPRRTSSRLMGAPVRARVATSGSESVVIQRPGNYLLADSLFWIATLCVRVSLFAAGCSYMNGLFVLARPTRRSYCKRGRQATSSRLLTIGSSQLWHAGFLSRLSTASDGQMPGPKRTTV